MKKTSIALLSLPFLAASGFLVAHQATPDRQSEVPAKFHWPNGQRAAVSLTFDDARVSQIDLGLPIFERMHVNPTFFLQSENIGKRIEGWKKAVADGDEIGNHSMTHPCTANYAFSKPNALEDYSLAKMAAQLDGANAEIERLLGVKPRTFAYPCGLKFVGRGLDVRSYVPLVAERFVAGRGYMDEAANDPEVCDLAQAMGTPFDDTDFEFMKKKVDEAAEQGRWVIFVGHDIGKRGFQVTDAAELESLCNYLKEPAHGIWLGTVAEIAAYVRQQQARRQ